MATQNIETLRARVQALELSLFQDSTTQDGEDKRYIVFDPKAERIVLLPRTVAELGALVGDLEDDATDADEQQACAAAFERQKAAGMHADVESAEHPLTPAECRDRACELIEGIRETIRMARNSADRETAAVLALLDHSIETVDNLVMDIMLPSDKGGAA